MNQIEYLTSHCIPTGWQEMRSAFRIWKDLMTGNYGDYTLLHTDDPFEECRGWFWEALGADEVLPKSFLEYLIELMRKIDAGEEKLVEMNLERLADLIEILEVNEYGDV